ncbi:MAG: hypothetical protein N2167_11105 [Flavobacteriales bacterium]|nr:hypothetical protein [Flavobacteriales bacterium]
MQQKFFYILLLLLFSHCNGIKNIHIWQEGINHPLTFNDSLQIKYFGVGCMQITSGKRQVITDPFISRLSLIQTAFGKAHSDFLEIKKRLSSTEHTSFMLIGHGHYDHALDVPALDSLIPSNGKIVGSYSFKNQMTPFNLNHEFIVAETHFYKWIYCTDSTVRIMPIPSNHAPHFMGIRLYHGQYEKPPKKILTKTSQWKDGTIVAFLIDFLNNLQIEHRIFIQTSSASYFKDLQLEKEIKYRLPDVAVMNYYTLQSWMKKYSDETHETFGKQVIVCHWENFFRKWHQPVRLLKKWQCAKTLQLLQKKSDQFIVPMQGSKLSFK